jgi:hypothetical protein
MHNFNYCTMNYIISASRCIIFFCALSNYLEHLYFIYEKTGTLKITRQKKTVTQKPHIP